MPTMNYHADLARIRAIRKWACLPGQLRAIAAAHVSGGFSVVDAEALVAMRQPRQLAAGVVVLPLYGLITQRGGWFGCGTEEYWQMFAAALADSAVTAIVIEHDSPGGEVYGTEELAMRIFKARGIKPIISSVNSLMASADTWIGVQADEVMMTPSGEAGSVGVYTVHEDWSGALDQAGIKVTFVSAGEGKVDGNEFEPLSPDAKADLQATVDRYYQPFVAQVARARKVPPKKIVSEWKAKCYGAKDAKALGMIDDIGTLEDAVARAVVLGRKRKSVSAAFDLRTYDDASEPPKEPEAPQEPEPTPAPAGPTAEQREAMARLRVR